MKTENEKLDILLRDIGNSIVIMLMSPNGRALQGTPEMDDLARSLRDIMKYRADYLGYTKPKEFKK